MGESTSDDKDEVDGTLGNVDIEGSVEMLGLFSRLAGNVDNEGLNIEDETSSSKGDSFKLLLLVLSPLLSSESSLASFLPEMSTEVSSRF